MSQINIARAAEFYTLSLYENDLNRNDIQDIIEKTDKFISTNYVPFLIDKIKTELQEIVDEKLLSRITLILENNNNPLYKVKTEKLRLKYYEQDCGYTPPENIEIFKDLSIEKDNFKTDSSVSAVKTKSIKASYVPLHKSLKALLQVPNLLDEILKYQKHLLQQTVVVSNIIQAKLWQNKHANSKEIILPITLYYDDFDAGNTLGSHSGEQLLGGVYILLPFLPPHLAFKLDNILLAGVFYAKHRKEFGNRIVFDEIIKHINILSKDGIIVNGRRVFFRCIALEGDNLGLNSICGFSNNFNCNIYCRVCESNSKDCRMLCQEDIKTIRNKEKYEEYFNTGTFMEHGIIEKCIFNDLLDFHIIEHESTDLMHNLCEGVCEYTVSKILTNIIVNDKIITLKTLNERIKNFNYGDLESSNKPRPISMAQSKKKKNDNFVNKIKIRQSASEMLCLTRYLGVMIGELIPEYNQSWELYKILNQLVSLLTSPRFVNSDLNTINFLVYSHNKKYIELFGFLKPKMHFLTHVGRIMENLGPAIHLWGFPGERKNKSLKNIISSTSSRINIPFSAAVRHQLRECFLRFHPLINIENDVEMGTLQKENFFEIRKYLENINSAKSFNFITVRGKKYSPGTIIIVEINDQPTFGEIDKILEVDGKIQFIIFKMYVINFDSHYQAFEVLISEKKEMVSLESLPKLPPCLLVTIQSINYIATRFKI